MESPFRRLTHQALRSLKIEGKVLDLGGSKKSEYRSIIAQMAESITVLNLDPSAEPDVMADLEKPFPLENAAFETVLALNVLEHLYSTREFLRESWRVLRPGGSLILVVPFLFQVHPSPHDFFRFTKGALEKLLEETSFTDIQITELGSGVMSVRSQLLYNFLPAPLASLSVRMAVLGDFLITFFARLLGKKYDPATYPLGYCVVARKNLELASSSYAS